MRRCGPASDLQSACETVLAARISNPALAVDNMQLGRLPATIQQAEIIFDPALRVVKHQCGSRGLQWHRSQERRDSSGTTSLLKALIERSTGSRGMTPGLEDHGGFPSHRACLGPLFI